MFSSVSVAPRSFTLFSSVKKGVDMAGKYTRFTPRCEYGCIGYVTFLLGPRGGVHGVWPCIECGRMPRSKPSGYISYPIYSKPAKEGKPHADEDTAA